MEEQNQSSTLIKALIAEDRLDEAFQQIKNDPFLQPLEKEIIVLQSRLQQLRRESLMGTMEAGQLLAAKNKIILSLLELLEQHYARQEQTSSPFKEIAPDSWFSNPVESSLKKFIHSIFNRKGK